MLTTKLFTSLEIWQQEKALNGSAKHLAGEPGSNHSTPLPAPAAPSDATQPRGHGGRRAERRDTLQTTFFQFNNSKQLATHLAPDPIYPSCLVKRFV